MSTEGQRHDDAEGRVQEAADVAGARTADIAAAAVAGLTAATDAAQQAAGEAEHAADQAARTGADRVKDVQLSQAAESHEVVYHGAIWDVVAERFTLPEQEGTVRREFIEHPGAVGIIALDEQGRVLLQRQRRQPVHAELWEVPAGLLDVDGEPALDTAARELFEEADLRAARWDVLVDQYNSPGSSSEAIRVYLARDLSEVGEHERFERTDEELGMEGVWLPVADAVEAVLSGRVGNPTTVSGVLALAANLADDFRHLRPADAAWPARPDRV